MPPDYNPLKSPIKEIYIGSLLITKPNTECRFEKIEFSESVFDLFPSGALIVRDLNDIVSYVRSIGLSDSRTITIVYDIGASEVFYINEISHLTNAASETEENFISLHFTNKLFFVNQNKSVTSLLPGFSSPQVFNIPNFLSNLTDAIKNSTTDWGGYPPSLINWGPRKCSNVMVYRPINPMESKVDEVSENPIQYMNYISSMAVDSVGGAPRFLFWTGFNNQINFKYFTSADSDGSLYGSYGVFQQDSPQIRTSDDSTRKKIYILTTAPASQYLNKKYYYIRKTPTILNNASSLSKETQLVNHQFLDDGKKYDIEIITENGVVSNLPGDSGLQAIDYDSHYGYYQQNDVFNQVHNSTMLGMEYGTKNQYNGKTLMNVSSPYQFIDNPEMWKNMWDLTPVHPNTGSTVVGEINAAFTNLQKVLEIRENTKTDVSKLEQIRDIELQNFAYYVLCCLTSKQEQLEEEETFFACITGWKPDTTNAENGRNGEPLRYRYSWKRLEVTLDPLEVENFNNWTNPEYSIWSFSGEASNANDITTWAINLNERKNNVDLENSNLDVYAPGWYTKNLREEVFINSVKYRAIGQGGGEQTTTNSATETSCYHIVAMRKIPFIRIVLNAINYEDEVSADPELLQQYIDATRGKYLYHFELSNITDGKCNPPQQGGQ